MPQTEHAQRVLLIVMDGIGLREDRFGNAVALASTPTMLGLKKLPLFTRLKAHGKSVGLPSDSDIGNSEVGHNALGAGRIFEQGASLVNQALETGSLYDGKTWKDLISFCKKNKGTLHFLGLLSDGNVHSHENHLFGLMAKAKEEGLKRVRIHVLLDGRDVPEKSAEIYIKRLQREIDALSSPQFDIKIASGGGRMSITMDRYQADWAMVERGWQAHVLGQSPNRFGSVQEAIGYFRGQSDLSDQYIPSFVIVEGVEGKQTPVGTINDGDGVVLFNYRGDRAIEISRAFTEEAFEPFSRVKFPKTYYAGMMEYDGDLHIPPNFLVSPPAIDQTLSEYLLSYGKRQFACSETQKFGHVTFFWNGNRSGYLDASKEEYVEVPSDNITFDKKPAMKAEEIADIAIDRMRRKTFDFGRINFANGDMVGHTGNLKATIEAVQVVDKQLGRLIGVALETDTTLIITADHGNADEMFDGKEKDFPNWETNPGEIPPPKTSHTLAPVPFVICGPGSELFELRNLNERNLGNVAATVLELLGLPPNEIYLPSLIKKRDRRDD
jgi:2,3-bisphosphoglycerate-independent phosphoglycerate mutase